jgi:hypothetical protein
MKTGQKGAHAVGLDSPVSDLNCDSSIKCRNARLALVKRGHQSVPSLSSALKKGTQMIPLEAAKALGNIGGPQATQALIEHWKMKDSRCAGRLPKPS